ncbi:MAG: ammonia-forming cytochrome c nitrite reductase subunit c552, partial [Mariniphaga sp.]|nr:ammonia-forming cytochrome c nitrite reductase subunit c552 [Mariniphaga sp.]
PSHHGKAMQPITSVFLIEDSIPSSTDFAIEEKMYQMVIRDTTLLMLEKEQNQVAEFKIIWALGGKNVYYFLTSIGQGKLQTIPLAYDLRIKKWYNNPESAVRHFPEGNPDEALPWKDRMYTFNTSCYSCHVSQLKTNYSLASDSYNTTWKEPGINCETCHGPSSEHVRIFRNLKEGEEPDNIGLIVTKTFTPEQHNASCAPCHAKMRPITASFMPGDRYYDNYDLTTLEHSDFYPDGRDLGENYTMTGWAMNECSINSDMHCVTCHTSSGRTRFTGDESNFLCLPCHKDNVDNVSLHSRHYEGSEGAVCINCHMPKTEFGRMVRSDHSFRPPMPEATLKFESPNACNICHKDKSPEWANQIVKTRKKNQYQEETLFWAQLIKEARTGNWENLDQILDIIKNDSYGEVVTNSFVRLLAGCDNEKKWDGLLLALNNSSPLVRSSAASGLTGNYTEEARIALVKACSDDLRVVRIAAALTIASFPDDLFSIAEMEIITKATNEYKQSLLARPDDWSAHYNMGIFYQNKGDLDNAVGSYETSSRLYPEAILPLINSSVLYSYIGNPIKAEESLKKALQIDPDNEAANLNLGLLLAEQGKTDDAIKALLKALEVNPKQAVAAYNLSVLNSGVNIEEAIRFAIIACEAAPENPRYGYTLAFFQNQAGFTGNAIKTLNEVLQKHPSDLNSAYLLGDIYLQDGNTNKALNLYYNLLILENLQDSDKLRIQQIISQLES